MISNAVSTRLARLAVSVTYLDDWQWDEADSKLAALFDAWRIQHANAQIIGLTIGPRRSSHWIEYPPVLTIQVLFIEDTTQA